MEPRLPTAEELEKFQDALRRYLILSGYTVRVQIHIRPGDGPGMIHGVAT